MMHTRILRLALAAFVPIEYRAGMRVPAFCLAVLTSVVVGAAEPPAFFTLPAPVEIGALEVEEWGEASFRLDDDVNLRRGRHWSFVLSVPGLADGAAGAEIWASLEPALTKAGWRVLRRYDASPLSLTLRREREGKDAWAFLWLLEASDVRVQVVEVAPQPVKLKLTPPAKIREALSIDGSAFPFLTPLPRAVLTGSERVDGPLLLPLDAEGETEEVVASGFFRRAYAGPEGVSTVQSVTIYRDALEASGWKVLHVGQDLNRADGLVVAHYTNDGRDVWAAVRSGGSEYTFDVADVGGDNLAEALRRECRATLVGVFFDFDKATLKPESAAVLARGRAAILAMPGSSFVIEGHTDNVGEEAYNQRLSAQRAAAVGTWLTANGVPADRLSSQGYGETRPLASNDEADGRARNRRVELTCRSGE